MIHCSRYDPATGSFEPVAGEEAPDCLAHLDQVLWVDVEHAVEDDYTWLSQTFSLHPLALEDLRNQRQRPKVDEYDGYLFVTLRALERRRGNHRLESHEVDVILGAHFLITFHQAAIHAVTRLQQHLEQAKLPGQSAAFLFYRVLDAVVDGYFPIVDKIGDAIDDIDGEIFRHADAAQLQTIFSLRRNLLTIRRLLAPLRDALNELIRLDDEQYFHNPHFRAYLLDVFDHVLRLTDFVDTFRDMLSGSLEAYQSSLSNRLNANMQRLTVVTTVLATATVITGFYGMNLFGLGINSHWGYSGHVLLLVLVVVTAVELWLFHRYKWI
jgi:magnesium transporter